MASPTILSAITSPASQPFDDVASTATVSLSKDTPVFTGVDPDMTTRSPFTGIDSDPTLTASAFGVGSVARTMNGTSVSIYVSVSAVKVAYIEIGCTKQGCSYKAGYRIEECCRLGQDSRKCVDWVGCGWSVGSRVRSTRYLQHKQICSGQLPLTATLVTYLA